jgi:hypothetical protein
MILSDPAAVLDALIDGAPLPLKGLPRTHGLYTLHDHEGARRYIGTTDRDPLGFHGRVCNRHVGGSEGYSHKFSQAYNTGRMWQARKGYPGQATTDAKHAKDLRRFFARRFCCVTIFPIANPGLAEDDFFVALTDLERHVQRLAPRIMRSWEGKQFPVMDEPRSQVDLLLDELKWSADYRASIERQAVLYASQA